MGTERIKREIIFFYILSSSSGFIRNKGINLSSAYDFLVEENDRKYVLKEKRVSGKKVTPKGFFESVGNITAIVGKNGTGKTTFLKELCKRIGYDKGGKYTDDRLIILLENDELVCYHNLEWLEISPDIGLPIKEIDYRKNTLLRKSHIRNVSGPCGFTTIVFSNSIYWDRDYEMVNTFGGVTMEAGEFLTSVFLTIDTIASYARDFFREKIRRAENIVGGYYQFLDLCINRKTARDFQQILDIFYLRECKDVEITKWFEPVFRVFFRSYRSYIDEELDHFREEKESGNKNSVGFAFAESLAEADKDINTIIADIDYLSGSDPIFEMYLNLLFDLLLYDRSERIRGILRNRELGKAESKEEIKKMIRTIVEGDKSSDISGFAGYMNDIDEFDRIMSDDYLQPVSEKSHRQEYVIEMNSGTYESFTKLIHSHILREKESFLLRYLFVSGLTFSSGERTLLNFYTWQYMIGRQQELFHRKNRVIQDNVLLLIDEIDLCLHPEWQQKMISELIKFTEKTFADKFVQIVYTTHSPITLSDMPGGNVVYLDISEEGGCLIDNRKKHGQTFGSNIYRLYDDAFFLKEKGQIGEFAKNKIRDIINEIKPKEVGESVNFPVLSKQRRKELSLEINMIGDPVLRNQLSRMLMLCENNDENETLLDRKIIRLERQLDELRKMREDG